MRIPTATTQTMQTVQEIPLVKERSIEGTQAQASPEVHQDTIHNESRSARMQSELALSGQLQRANLLAQVDVLGVGSTGPKVLELQKNLNELRAAQGKPPIVADGVFGPKTEAAVKEFQREQGLAADGLAGPNVKASLSVENDPNFKNLSPAVQNRIRSMMAEFQENPTARDNLVKIARDENFDEMSTESQQIALDKFSQNPQSAAHTQNVRDTSKDVAEMENERELALLPEGTKTEFRKAMFEYSHSPDGRKGLRTLANSDSIRTLNAEQQSRIIGIAVKNANAKFGEAVPDFMKLIIDTKVFHEGFVSDEKIATYLDAADAAAPDPGKLAELEDLFNDSDFANASLDEQRALLAAFRGRSGL